MVIEQPGSYETTESPCLSWVAVGGCYCQGYTPQACCDSLGDAAFEQVAASTAATTRIMTTMSSSSSFLQTGLCMYVMNLFFAGGKGFAVTGEMLSLWIYNEAMQQCSSLHSNAPTADVITFNDAWC